MGCVPSSSAEQERARRRASELARDVGVLSEQQTLDIRAVTSAWPSRSSSCPP